MSTPHLQTIAEAKDYLHEHRFDGAKCPCCGQVSRIYRRKVTRSQVLFLRDLLATSRKANAGARLAFVDVRTIEGQHMRGGDYAKLAYWGLAQRGSGDPGYWALTAKGLGFLRGTIRIPRYLWIEDGHVIRQDSDTIDVHDAYRERFNLVDIYE